MAMNNALLRAVRSISGRRIACRSFVTEYVNSTEDLKQVSVSDDAKDSTVRVWWDVQRCKVPPDREAGTVVSNVRDALRRIHCCLGPVEFYGYGDMTMVPFLTQAGLHKAGVRLRHVPHGLALKDEVMIGDMIFWTKDHPPPAVHMLITERLYYPCEVDRLKKVFHKLRVRGYDALLVQHPDPKQELTSYESDPERIDNFERRLRREIDTAWLWEALLAGPKV